MVQWQNPSEIKACRSDLCLRYHIKKLLFEMLQRTKGKKKKKVRKVQHWSLLLPQERVQEQKLHGFISVSGARTAQ